MHVPPRLLDLNREVSFTVKMNVRSIAADFTKHKPTKQKAR